MILRIFYCTKKRPDSLSERRKLFCIMNIPAERSELRRSCVVKHIVVLKLCKIEIAVIGLFFLISAENPLDLGESSARRLLNYSTETMMFTHKCDDISSRCEQLIAYVVDSHIRHIVRILCKAENEVNEVVDAAHLESVLTLTVDEFCAVSRIGDL